MKTGHLYASRGGRQIPFVLMVLVLVLVLVPVQYYVSPFIWGDHPKITYLTSHLSTHKVRPDGEKADEAHEAHEAHEDRLKPSCNSA